MANNSLVEVKNLTKYFPVKRGFLFGRKISWLKAVDGVTFHLNRGETLGLVGESGCGKSTIGRLIIGLLSPTSGEVFLEGENISAMNGERRKQLHRRMQIIFQDPFGSLNPRMTAGDIVAEPLYIHDLAKGPAAQKRVRQLFEYVGLSSYALRRYPHEFSGGQRQRIGIARALAVDPELIVCDEPVSALDVSIQSQILNLLADLQKELGLTYLFIAHGLNVVKHVSNRVCIMYLGKLVEMAPGNDFYTNPQHPYTRALLSAIPIPNPKAKRQRIILEGDVLSPIDPPPGCRFASRCPVVMAVCSEVEPLLNEVRPNHFVACHLVPENSRHAQS